jgi:hypothetical protein
MAQEMVFGFMSGTGEAHYGRWLFQHRVINKITGKVMILADYYTKSPVDDWLNAWLPKDLGNLGNLRERQCFQAQFDFNQAVPSPFV